MYSYRIDHSVFSQIKDNGIGIDLNENSNIFEIFNRKSNTDRFEGTGIGLSIVKRIADRLNAKISVESKLNVGTTFTIEFVNVPS